MGKKKNNKKYNKHLENHTIDTFDYDFNDFFNMSFYIFGVSDTVNMFCKLFEYIKECDGNEKK